MPVNYTDFSEAQDQQGLRLVVVPGLPSPWSEAAKGILHVKKIPYIAVRLDQRDHDMAKWTGTRNAPVAMYDKDAPRSGWSEILMLAEKLSPHTPLLPIEPKARAWMLDCCHDICGEMGLGWSRRLEGVHNGLTGQGGFPAPIAKYLGAKYGYQAAQASQYTARVAALLNMLAQYLHQQRDTGQRFYVGTELSALDIYSATFMAYFCPLPQDQCPMEGYMRAAFDGVQESIAAALDPILLEHRDFIYAEYLELPLSL